MCAQTHSEYSAVAATDMAWCDPRIVQLHTYMAPQPGFLTRSRRLWVNHRLLNWVDRLGAYWAAVSRGGGLSSDGSGASQLHSLALQR
jgi:hypothetical protein